MSCKMLVYAHSNSMSGTQCLSKVCSTLSTIAAMDSFCYRIIYIQAIWA